MTTLLLLGLALSLDSFRVSLGLGAMRLPVLRQAQIVAAFGLSDGLMPLAGMLIGQTVLQVAEPWTEHLGPMVLGAYGAYVIYIAQRYGQSGERAEAGGWIVYGLPLSLSLDNLVAGTSLGMNGSPLPLSVAVMGTISGLASLTGLLLGRMATRVLPIRAELVAGLGLVGTAVAMAIGPG